MNCEQVRVKIEDYRENALTAENMAVVETHLSQCESCRLFLAEIDCLHGALHGALRRHTVPEDFANRIVAATNNVAGPTRSTSRNWVVRIGVPLAAAAVLLVCLILVPEQPAEKQTSVAATKALPFFEPPTDARPAAGKPFVITASGQSPYPAEAYVQVSYFKDGTPQLLVAAFRDDGKAEAL